MKRDGISENLVQHLALLRSSAMISQYFMRTNVGQFIEKCVEKHEHTADFKECIRLAAIHDSATATGFDQLMPLF
jgi:hypothetical protein